MLRLNRAMRMAVVLALTALAPAMAVAQAAPRAEAVPQQGDLVVTGIPVGGAVNLRDGPANAFPALGAVRRDQVLRNLGCRSGLTGRWCQVQTREARPLRGWIKAEFVTEATLRPPVEDGGPDFYAVRGLPPGDRLTVRREPSPQARAIATLREGEVVRNLGCQGRGNARWCRIRSTEGIDVTGWVAGRFLRESGPPAPPGGGGGAGLAVVAGLPPGDRLNLRAEPSAQSRILGSLGSGERVRNLGCRNSGNTRWCQVRTTGGVEVTGWVNGRYLRGG